MSEPSTTDTRGVVLADLAPTGAVRAAINLGNPVLAQRDEATGKLAGVSVALANEVARRLGRPLELIAFDAAGKVFDALRSAAWDIAFLAIDPVRAEQMAFTAPYVLIEGTYLVRAESPLHELEHFDRPGVRIAVGRGAAYDLFLTRTLAHAELVRSDTSASAIEAFVQQGLDAVAGVRQPLLAYARAHPGFRVLDASFTSIRQAMAVPRGRAAGLAYLRAFVEEMKASGFVAAALHRSGQMDAAVAPPESVDGAR